MAGWMQGRREAKRNDALFLAAPAADPEAMPEVPQAERKSFLMVMGRFPIRGV